MAEPLRLALCDAGFMVRALMDKAAAMEVIAVHPPQMLIVDWNMPYNGGFELVQAVRSADAAQGIGLIILSTLSEEHDVVSGLNLGADDYVAKPFSPREVVARAKAVLRMRGRRGMQDVLTCGEIVLDATTNSATASQRPLTLSPLEYRLLEFFMKHQGRTFNRAQLLAQVWGSHAVIDERTVDVNVQRLRRLLTGPKCDSYIQTVRGFGYRLAAPVPLVALAGAD